MVHRRVNPRHRRAQPGRHEVQLPRRPGKSDV